MGPTNGAVLQRQNPNSAKELSWLDRVQLKLDRLCEADGGRNPTEVLHDSSVFFESQLCAVGANVRNFCSEFVRELLAPEDGTEVDASNTLEQDTELTSNGDGVVSTERSRKVVGVRRSVDGSSSQVVAERRATLMTEPREIIAESKTAPAVVGTPPRPPSIPDAPVFFIDHSEQDLRTSKFVDEEAEQYARWFVTEDYRRMRLGKSTSTSSIQSWDGHHRAPSTDRLFCSTCPPKRSTPVDVVQYVSVAKRSWIAAG
ncbi:hypothetical protein R1sor_011410 [Riccia sorocarpa]|uniref:Uncharacterized protein n=1 Tax=Riccia sorocarpa TaxID=122646 RepID=A0ABD3I493_9MARC